MSTKRHWAAGAVISCLTLAASASAQAHAGQSRAKADPVAQGGGWIIAQGMGGSVKKPGETTGSKDDGNRPQQSEKRDKSRETPGSKDDETPGPKPDEDPPPPPPPPPKKSD